MKKTFLTRRNALLTPGSISWGGYALIIVLVLLVLRLLAPDLYFTIFAPVFHLSDTIASDTHAFFSSFGDRSALALDNENLEKENTALALENETLLQTVAGLSLTPPSTGQINAAIISRPPESPYDTLLIAPGAQAGVTLGMEAFSSATSQAALGVPIGIVSATHTDFSRITLFSSPGVRTLAWVGKSALPITLVGTGGGTFDSSAARAANIVIGDTVFVPGPGQLAMGKVVRIDSDPSLPVVILRITPAVNLYTLNTIQLRDVGAGFARALLTATSTLP